MNYPNGTESRDRHPRARGGKKPVGGLTMALGLAALVLFLNGVSPGETMEVVTRTGGVAVFGVGPGGGPMEALARETTGALRSMFNRGGRLLPVEEYRLLNALTTVRGRGIPPEKAYEAAARLLNADVYVVVSVARLGGVYAGEMAMFPLSGEYPGFAGTARVKSAIMTNIPLKLAMVVARKHRGVPLKCAAQGEAPGGLKVINAGQWHGIDEGRYRALDGRMIEIVSAGRYESTARVPGEEDGGQFIIPVYPPADRLAGRMAVRIEENIIMKYGLGNTLLKSENPEKRYIEGMCVINPGSNLCMPGYGAFLATHYLGFQKKSPDLPGVILSTALIGAHFLTVPAMTGFRGHFFPWVDDADKSGAERGLQVFLWITAPLTVSAAYFDQLAVQCESAGVLPPFYADRDVMAGVLSVLVPGGGLFYKGRRLAGWAYYLLEMPLAGYGIYAMGENRRAGLMALGAAGGLKLLEIAHAVIVSPGHGVYRRETAARSERVRFQAGWVPGENGDSRWRLGLVFSLDPQ